MRTSRGQGRDDQAYAEQIGPRVGRPGGRLIGWHTALMPWRRVRPWKLGATPQAAIASARWTLRVDGIYKSRPMRWKTQLGGGDATPGCGDAPGRGSHSSGHGDQKQAEATSRKWSCWRRGSGSTQLGLWAASWCRACSTRPQCSRRRRNYERVKVLEAREQDVPPRLGELAPRPSRPVSGVAEASDKRVKVLERGEQERAAALGELARVCMAVGGAAIRRQAAEGAGDAGAGAHNPLGRGGAAHRSRQQGGRCIGTAPEDSQKSGSWSRRSATLTSTSRWHVWRRRSVRRLRKQSKRLPAWRPWWLRIQQMQKLQAQAKEKNTPRTQDSGCSSG